MGELTVKYVRLEKGESPDAWNQRSSAQTNACMVKLPSNGISEGLCLWVCKSMTKHEVSRILHVVTLDVHPAYWACLFLGHEHEDSETEQLPRHRRSRDCWWQART